MKGQKALLLGGLVAALALGSAVGASAGTGRPAGPRAKDREGLKGLLAQAPDVPGLGDDKPADKPAPAPKAATGAFIVTRQDGTKVQGKVHDNGDSIIV